MATTSESKRRVWQKNKAKIIAEVGSITALARLCGCSVQAIRRAALKEGCPKVAAKMREVLG